MWVFVVHVFLKLICLSAFVSALGSNEMGRNKLSIIISSNIIKSSTVSRDQLLVEASYMYIGEGICSFRPVNTCATHQ